MDNQPYKIVYTGGSDEIVEKKSRFIATIEPVKSEEEAVAFLNKIKKQYWDARHNCHAFVIGSNQELSRCSDDGEPSGTAGRPILDVLLREEIHNCIVVVTRYFGGTLLGTGGLVRAYQKATQQGLAACEIVEKIQGITLEVGTDYNGLGKIQYLTAQNDIAVLDTEYTEQVKMSLLVPMEKKQQFEAIIVEGTDGAARLEYGDHVEYCILNQSGEKKVKIF